MVLNGVTVTSQITCFKAYDARGRVPDELNIDVVYRIGRAYAAFLQPRKVVIGYDIRLSSPDLTEALANGLMDSGVDVYDIGLCGTEQVYFATFHANMDGGIMVTASHNPPDYNGLKFVREDAKPLSGNNGLQDIRRLAEENQFTDVINHGQRHTLNVDDAYIEHLLSYVDRALLKPLKIVVNAGNGSAGTVIDRLETQLPFEFIKLQHTPDGTFPHGVPNPLLPENRGITADSVREHGAELGIAWDGDFDRCFLFDERGTFVEGYYIVGLLAQAMLERSAGEAIVHDPRLIWNSIEMIEAHGGTPVQSVSGHSFMKQKMREVNAVYGGEMSAHHFFRDFAYCDSGMIPWLLVTQIMCVEAKSLTEMVGERQRKYPTSGEINRKVDDVQATIARIEAKYADRAKHLDHTDGLGVEFDDWRFNIRGSNTEPLIRLNVESRGDPEQVRQATAELLALIEQS